jgi:alkyldihydroxyacetonephosphate synthase
MPPVVRQYDARETRRNFKEWSVKGDGMLMMVHEGPVGRVAAEVEAVDALAAQCGLTRADDQVATHWMENRNHVPSWTELFDQDLVVDTIEVSGSWSNIELIYDQSIADVSAVEGVVAVSAHSSHAYRTGVNLYFTFAGLSDDPQVLENIYLACWHAVMEATAAHGGGVAHHHGIGRVRKPYLVHDLGEAGVALLRTVKNAVDPEGLMNPGNLVPDA